MKKECEEVLNKKLETLKERGAKSTFIIENELRQLYTKVTVDGCEITSSKVLKCDFLLLLKNKQVEVYVELKGQNVSHACDQIASTIKQLGDQANAKLAFVIVTRNKLPATSTAKLKKSFRKKEKCKLEIKRTPYTYILS